MRAGAESSRTTASVGSLGEQTLFAQRSPYGHPKSEIRSQVCFGRGDLSLWIGGPSGEAGRLGGPQTVQTEVDWGRPGLRRLRGRGGALSSIPGPSARLGWGVRAEIAGRHCAIANRALRAIADGPSVNDRGPCQCGRSRTLPA